MPSDADSAVRLAAALGWYWTLRGAHQEAAVRIGAALDVPGDSPNVPRSICLAMHVLNAGAGGLPAVDPEATLAELQRLRPQAESDEHPVMALLDTVVALLGDDMDAGAAARAHALEHPDPWVHAMVRFMGAAMAENSGDQRGYRDELDAALTGFRQVGDRWGIAMCLTQSAGLSLLDGDRTGAIEAYDEAGELMRELGASDDAGQTAARKAMVLAAEGELEAARATLLRAQEAAQRSGSALSESLITLGLADVDRLRGDLAAARSRIEQALDRLDAPGFMGPGQVRAMLLLGLGNVEIAAGELALARTHLGEAAVVGRASTDMPVAALVCVGFASLAWAEGDATLAASRLGAAEAVRGGPDRSHPDIRTLDAALRAALGDDAHAAARAAGAHLDREAALDLGCPVPAQEE